MFEINGLTTLMTHLVVICLLLTIGLMALVESKWFCQLLVSIKGRGSPRKKRVQASVDCWEPLHKAKLTLYWMFITLLLPCAVLSGLYVSTDNFDTDLLHDLRLAAAFVIFAVSITIPAAALFGKDLVRPSKKNKNRADFATYAGGPALIMAGVGVFAVALFAYWTVPSELKGQQYTVFIVAGFFYVSLYELLGKLIAFFAPIGDNELQEIKMARKR